MQNKMSTSLCDINYKHNFFSGPDICGPGTKKVHVIFNYKGQNLLTKKDIRCKVQSHYCEKFHLETGLMWCV